MSNETVWIDCFFYGFYMSKEIYNKYIVYPKKNMQYFEHEESSTPKSVFLVKQKSRKKCLDQETRKRPDILQTILFLFDFKHFNSQFYQYLKYIFSLKKEYFHIDNSLIRALMNSYTN